MSAGSSEVFKQTLVRAYYYIMVVDMKIDLKEISYGTSMIEKEKIDRTEFDQLIDGYTYEDINEVKSQLAKQMEELSFDQQLRILGYMTQMAEVDGEVDPKEHATIKELCDRFKIDPVAVKNEKLKIS